MKGRITIGLLREFYVLTVEKCDEVKQEVHMLHTHPPPPPKSFKGCMFHCFNKLDFLSVFFYADTTAINNEKDQLIIKSVFL